MQRVVICLRLYFVYHYSICLCLSSPTHMPCDFQHYRGSVHAQYKQVFASTFCFLNYSYPSTISSRVFYVLDTVVGARDKGRSMNWGKSMKFGLGQGVNSDFFGCTILNSQLTSLRITSLHFILLIFIWLALGLSCGM